MLVTQFQCATSTTWDKLDSEEDLNSKLAIAVRKTSMFTEKLNSKAHSMLYDYKPAH